MLQHVYLTVRLLHSTYVIDERKKRTKMSNTYSQL